MVFIEIFGSVLVLCSISLILIVVYLKSHAHHRSISHTRPSMISTIPIDQVNETRPTDLKMIHVIHHEPIPSSTPIKYGIQWKIPTTLSESPAMKSLEFDQGDSLSLTDTTTSVKELIERFEKNQTEKSDEKIILKNKDKSNMTDSELTSLDSQTIKLDLNQNQFHFSHHSSISNFDVTVPSNLSSSIDLEHFECISTTSDLSECLRQMEKK